MPQSADTNVTHKIQITCLCFVPVKSCRSSIASGTTKGHKAANYQTQKNVIKFNNLFNVLFK